MRKVRIILVGIAALFAAGISAPGALAASGFRPHTAEAAEASAPEASAASGSGSHADSGFRPYTAAEAFENLPIEVLDLLSKSTRLDMLDFYKVDSIYNARNTMEGISRLKKVTPTFLSVTLTPVSELSLQVLSGKKGDLVMTAYTVGDEHQAYDTDLRFYDSQYRELQRDKYVKIAELDDFFSYPDKKTKERVRELIPFPTVRYELSPDASEMTARLTVGQFMSADDYASVKPYMKDELHYVWNGSKYKMQ